MALASGTHLGTYEILEAIGAGGMGEVYRARDSKLKRDVAIKVLPDEFSRDADRIVRFQREAEVLASLNHPNIAAIYNLEEASGSRYLVLELVEGETLAERLKRDPLTIPEVLRLATQICEALEAAHEKGIIHRDLKPANIKITPEGKVKLLDFGLARIFEEPANADLANSPTMMSRTGHGIILGTAAYMSPEQARGETVDRRADIWAFGCVLYEMLTQHPGFEGKTVTDLLGAIIHKDIDWSALPPSTPSKIRALLRRCLQKESAQRLRHIGDAAIEISEALADPGDAADVAPAITRKHNWGVLAFAFAATVALAIVSFLYFNRVEPREIRLQVNTPPTMDPLSIALSPDGQRLAFVGIIDGKSQLFVRPLDSLVAQPLAGTDGAYFPFWSPTSDSLGFFANGKLQRIDVSGGPPQVLASVSYGFGGAWGRDGTIVFAPAAVGPLRKLPATGGEVMPATQLQNVQVSHRFPQFLPDGKHFVYFDAYSSSGLYLGTLGSLESKRLAASDSFGIVTSAGFLFFLRQNVLLAQAFDLKTFELSGNAIPITEQIAFDPIPSRGAFTATSGIIAYRTGAVDTRQLRWFDRSGKVSGAIGNPDSEGMTNLELSPDGKRLAVQRTVNANNDVWLLDAARGVATRFTFDPALDAQPLWSPDGTRITFTSSRNRSFDLYQKLASGAGSEELLLQSDEAKAPTDWSPDGRFLLFRRASPQTGYDLWILPAFGDKKPYPFIKTQFEEREGQFSPDGKWVAYQSNESGRFEIYVQPFPGPGGKFQISTNGGAQVRWRRDSKEIFYVSLENKIMAVPVKISANGDSIESGTPVALFTARIAGGALPGPFKQQYAVSPDGQRFLVNVTTEDSGTSPINVIYNWKPKASR